MSNNGGSLTSHVRIDHAMRAAEALGHRLAGRSYDEIGALMGFSRQRAHVLVKGELDRLSGTIPGISSETDFRDDLSIEEGSENRPGEDCEDGEGVSEENRDESATQVSPTAAGSLPRRVQ
jgi:hypothetical protein